MPLVLPIFFGDDVDLALDFGIGYNLTGTTVLLTIKRNQNDATPLIVVTQASHISNTKTNLRIAKADVIANLASGQEYFGWIQTHTGAGDVQTIGDFKLKVKPAPLP